MLAQIGGSPARQAPPHQGRDPVRDALWEWKPVQYIPHILRYVVTLPEPTNKSSRSPVDPLSILHPNPRKTSEIKAAEYKSMNKGDNSIKSQRSINDPHLPKLIVAADQYVDRECKRTPRTSTAGEKVERTFLPPSDYLVVNSLCFEICPSAAAYLTNGYEICLRLPTNHLSVLFLIYLFTSTHPN